MLGDAIERYRRGSRRRAVALLADERLSVDQQARAVALGLLPRGAVSIAAQERLANADALQARAREAMEANRTIVESCETYLALPSPTNAQAVAQIRALTQSVRAIARHQTAQLRLALDMLDSTD